MKDMSYSRRITVGTTALLVFLLINVGAQAFIPNTRYSQTRQLSQWGFSLPSSPQSSFHLSASGGPAVLDKPATKKKSQESVGRKNESQNGKGWAVRLFNDPFNKREFVSRCLMEIAGLSDGQAYTVMMQAHQNGVAVVGQYHRERAELYRNRLVEYGLVSDMIPMDDDK